MFSLDDSFDLEEEDFLQAAIEIENKANSNEPNPTKTLELETVQSGTESRNNVSTTVDKQKETNNIFKLAPKEKQSFEHSTNGLKGNSTVSSLFKDVQNSSLSQPLFSISGTSSESDLDLQLEMSTPFDIETNTKENAIGKQQKGQKENTSLRNCAPMITQNKTKNVSMNESKSVPKQHTGLRNASNRIVTHNPQNSNINSLRQSQNNEAVNSQQKKSPVSSILLSKESDVNKNHPRLDEQKIDVFKTPVSAQEAPRPMKRKRKFPGPAGVLPKLGNGRTLENVNDMKVPSPIVERTNKPENITDFPSSQSWVEHFSDLPWTQMKKDMEPQANDIISEFNIAGIIRKAGRKQLPKGKVPVVCVMIDSLSPHSTDASVVLKDTSGEIKGTIHRQLMKEYPIQLAAGTVLVLRQVGVFSPSLRNHYLNITPNNVVRIYYKDLCNQLSTLKLASFSNEDFIMPVITQQTMSSSLLTENNQELSNTHRQDNQTRTSLFGSTGPSNSYSSRPPIRNPMGSSYQNTFTPRTPQMRPHQFSRTPQSSQNRMPYVSQNRMPYVSQNRTPYTPQNTQRFQRTPMQQPSNNFQNQASRLRGPSNASLSNSTPQNSANVSNSNQSVNKQNTSQHQYRFKTNQHKTVPSSGQQGSTLSVTSVSSTIPNGANNQQPKAVASVAELWGDGDDQLDDLLTGLEDEMMSDF